MGSLISKLEPEVDTDSEMSDDSDEPAANMLDMENMNESACNTIDAIGHNDNNQYKTINVNNLTIQHVIEIEDVLEIDEKISLIYLLFEDEMIAMQDMKLIMDGSKKSVITDWANSCLNKDRNINWQILLVEAMTVIQNFKILKQWGYDKIDLRNRFCPSQRLFSENLPPLKKCLYNIIDNLYPSESRELLSMISNDISSVLPQTNYLEYILIYLQDIKYISKNDLNNFKKHLKCLNKDVEASDLELLMNQIINNEMTTPDINTNVDLKIRDEIKNYEELNIVKRKQFNVDKTSPTQSTSSSYIDEISLETNYLRRNIIHNADDCYPIDPEHPGICLIINIEIFYTECDPDLIHLLPKEVGRDKIDDRLGTEYDKKRLQSTFKRFGFNVITHENKTHIEILDIIKKIAHESIQIEDCSLFICILSHGLEGTIIASNSIPVEISEIKKLICSDNLAGKPKVLILQSCQGKTVQQINEYVTDAPNATSLPKAKSSVAPTSDFYELWATVPGYAAIRSPNSGSWLIQALCETMLQYPSLHLADLCTKLQQKMHSKKWDYKDAHGKEETRVMVPLYTSTFSKFLYLPPLRL